MVCYVYSLPVTAGPLPSVGIRKVFVLLYLLYRLCKPDVNAVLTSVRRLPTYCIDLLVRWHFLSQSSVLGKIPV
jgi:hypothetical protein